MELTRTSSKTRCDGGPVQLLADDCIVHQLAHQDVLGLCYTVVVIYVSKRLTGRISHTIQWYAVHTQIFYLRNIKIGA